MQGNCDHDNCFENPIVTCDYCGDDICFSHINSDSSDRTFCSKDCKELYYMLGLWHG